jgi:acyl transferase domain-containing protein
MFHPDPDFPAKAYSIHGCFLDAIDLFDNRCFGISTTEASAMDPQQMCILEVGYEAYMRASYTKQALVAMPAGVFVGCGGNSKGACADAASSGPFLGTG